MDELSQLDEVSFNTGTVIAAHKGFPNAATEGGRNPLSLDKLLVSHPISTYFFRIRGHSWHRLGIFDGDIAVIDRSRTPRVGTIIVGWDETNTLHLGQWSPELHDNIWGVVTSIIHTFKN
jgi:hypothetical protein